jgi:SRSO17 transposase
MIKITINTESSAFVDVDDKDTEVARILRNIAMKFAAGEEVNWVHDVNGNRVAQVVEKKSIGFE